MKTFKAVLTVFSPALVTLCLLVSQANVGHTKKVSRSPAVERVLLKYEVENKLNNWYVKTK